MPDSNVFTVRDCSLLSLATGLRAHDLRELRSGLLAASTASIYHHLWGHFLRPQFDEPEYNNDFASWARHALHEKAMAEQLSVVNPADFETLDHVREELVEIVESRLDEREVVPWAASDQAFLFIESRIVVYPTGIELHDPAELATHIGHLSPGSVYYHFIDARRRTDDGHDDLSSWLTGFGDRWSPLVEELRGLDPYFSSLADSRTALAAIVDRHVHEEAE